MIIFRYLNKEVLMSMLAFTTVLLVIIITGRISKYLGNAAEGILNPNIMFWLIWYRLPEFLQLILPLGLFLGILLGLGRMYVDNEITVLLACGVSIKQVVMNLLGGVCLVMLIVGALSLSIAPNSNSKMDALWSQQDNSAMEFESLVPGRFQTQADNTRIAYSETLSADKKQLGNVFIAQTNKSAKKGKFSKETADTTTTMMVIVAESAVQKIKPETGDRFLILNNGYRYDGRPGQLDYREMQFSSYGVKVADGQMNNPIMTQSIQSTHELWNSKKPEDIAELQWRLSLPLLVPIVALLAVALSKVKPRQGRFAKLVPAFCVYLLYVLLLIGMRAAIKSGAVPAFIGMWWVHLSFLLYALVLFKQEQLMQWLRTIKHSSLQVGN